MVTKDKIDRFYKDVEELGLKFPVAAISKATGFVKGNVSDYLNKKKEPSENFLNAFYEAFESSIKVPRETQKSKDFLSGKSLEDFSDAHKTLANTNAQLAMAIVRVLPETRQDHTLVPKVVELIREAFSGKKQISFEELTKLLDKALVQDNGYKQ